MSGQDLPREVNLISLRRRSQADRLRYFVEQLSGNPFDPAAVVIGLSMLADELDASLPQARPDWDTYWMMMAYAVSTRSVCVRLKVGCVLTLNNRIISTGYNGAPAGQPDCPDLPCPRAGSGDPHYASYDNCIAIHGEANALLYAGGRATTEGATLYTTNKPCRDCFKLISGAGLKRVVFPGGSYYD